MFPTISPHFFCSDLSVIFWGLPWHRLAPALLLSVLTFLANFIPTFGPFFSLLFPVPLPERSLRPARAASRTWLSDQGSTQREKLRRELTKFKPNRRPNYW